MECGFKPRKRSERKKMELRKEETKEDHLQTQREEVEDQVHIPEEQGVDMADGRRCSARLKDKPRVN